MDSLQELFDIIYNQKALKEGISIVHGTDLLTIYLNSKKYEQVENRLKFLKGVIVDSISSSQKNLGPTIDQLNDAVEDFFEFDFEGIKINLQKGLTFHHVEPDEFEYYEINQVLKEPLKNKSIIKIFQKFSDLKFRYLNEIIELIQYADSSKSTIKKLKIKLSVADLSLLFRLLKEEGKLEIDNNTDLYKFIASSFSTTSADTLSDKSVKNKFLSPDNTAIKNLDFLLVNLRQQLRKIQ